MGQHSKREEYSMARVRKYGLVGAMEWRVEAFLSGFIVYQMRFMYI